MISKEKIDAIRIKYKILQIELDERGRRMWAAAEAKSFGHGGVVAVASATGLAESTIRLGRHEIGVTTLQAKKMEKFAGRRRAWDEKKTDQTKSTLPPFIL